MYITRGNVAGRLISEVAMRTALLALRFIPLLLLGAGAPAATLGCKDSTGPNGCCKVCKTGKPCGNTCISRTETCHTSGGCACQG